MSIDKFDALSIYILTLTYMYGVGVGSAIDTTRYTYTSVLALETRSTLTRYQIHKLITNETVWTMDLRAEDDEQLVQSYVDRNFPPHDHLIGYKV